MGGIGITAFKHVHNKTCVKSTQSHTPAACQQSAPTSRPQQPGAALPCVAAAKRHCWDMELRALNYSLWPRCSLQLVAAFQRTMWANQFTMWHSNASQVYCFHAPLCKRDILVSCCLVTAPGIPPPLASCPLIPPAACCCTPEPGCGCEQCRPAAQSLLLLQPLAHQAGDVMRPVLLHPVAAGCRASSGVAVMAQSQCGLCSAGRGGGGTHGHPHKLRHCEPASCLPASGHQGRG